MLVLRYYAHFLTLFAGINYDPALHPAHRAAAGRKQALHRKITTFVLKIRLFTRIDALSERFMAGGVTASASRCVRPGAAAEGGAGFPAQWTAPER